MRPQESPRAGPSLFAAAHTPRTARRPALLRLLQPCRGCGFHPHTACRCAPSRRANAGCAGPCTTPRPVRRGRRRQTPARRGRPQPRSRAPRTGAAAPIRSPACRHQRKAERQRVAGDDPLQRVRRRVRAPFDARQGHVHDRAVQHSHERAGQHDRENPPFPVARVAHRRPLPGQPRLKRRPDRRPPMPPRTRSFAPGTPGSRPTSASRPVNPQAAIRRDHEGRHL